jgi:hypothetical protein
MMRLYNDDMSLKVSSTDTNRCKKRRMLRLLTFKGHEVQVVHLVGITFSSVVLKAELFPAYHIICPLLSFCKCPMKYVHHCYAL